MPSSIVKRPSQSATTSCDIHNHINVNININSGSSTITAAAGADLPGRHVACAADSACSVAATGQ
jgi:hypothetical protein